LLDFRASFGGGGRHLGDTISDVPVPRVGVRSPGVVCGCCDFENGSCTNDNSLIILIVEVLLTR